MASTDTEAMLSREAASDWANRLPAASAQLQCRALDSFRVLTLRHFNAEHVVASACARAGFVSLPSPRNFIGTDPLLLWRSPSEYLCVATSHAHTTVDLLLDELAPSREPLACAIELTDGMVALEISGPRIDDLLSRLADASSAPRSAGQGSRMRLADIAIFALRPSEQILWLMADRSHARYLVDWLGYAADAIA